MFRRIYKHFKVSLKSETNKIINNFKANKRQSINEKFIKINSIFERRIKNEAKWN